MNTKIAELFQKKHYWEQKRDILYNRIVWDWQRSALIAVWIVFYISFFFTKGAIFFRGEMGWEWHNILRVSIYIVSILLWLYTLIKNTFDCYYKLPHYRRKIIELDHKIIIELKNLNY